MPPLESLRGAADAPALEAPVRRKRMLLVSNPYATTVSGRVTSLVVYALQGRYDVDAADTEGRDHATQLAREAAADGYDIVVAFGGDGTVNEAANGLAGSPTALFPLPGGATNVYCRMLGISGDVVDATEHLLRVADAWRPRRLDLGTVNGRHFLFSSGYGLDAAVVQVGDPYTYFSSHPLHVAEGIALDDGTLGGAVLERSSPIDVPTVMARLFARRLRVAEHRRVVAFNGVDAVTCASADGRPIPLQVDGDYIGDTVQARYEVLPGGLTVVW